MTESRGIQAFYQNLIPVEDMHAYAASMRIVSIVLVFLGCMLSACAQFLVPDQQYRCPPEQTSCNIAGGLRSAEERTTGQGHTYTVHYVEFNDRGELFDPLQLEDALSAVRRSPLNGKQTLLVVYVNGWQNNANETACDTPPCGDVGKFRDTLLGRLADDFPAFNVRGVYLAWRGLTFTVEPFKHVFSYWPRRSVARHVGQTGMYRAVNAMTDAVALQRQQYFYVLAGHSFGARVLENAADAFRDGHGKGFMTVYREQLRQRPVIRAEALSSQAAEERKVNTRLPADLIFYVNAATASTVTRRTIKDTEESCARNPGGELCDADPFYLAVTTHSDWATGLVMPLANLVFPALKSDGFHLFSAANSPWLHTHHDPKQIAETGSCPVDDTSPVAGFCFHLLGPDTRTHVKVAPIAGKVQHQFWVLNVGHKVMNGHGDVWNPTVTGMVSHVIARNQRFQILVRRAAALPLQ